MNESKYTALYTAENLLYTYPVHKKWLCNQATIAPRQENSIFFPSIRVEAGERLALLGANGCGKTTLLKLCNGLLVPSGGTLLYRGENIATSPLLATQTVYVHQHPYLFAGNVQYNAEYALKHLPKEKRTKAALEALDFFGLSSFEKRQAQRLSGGEAQRAALARALAGGARVLLLDEPTASADAQSAQLICRRLKELSGYTILFSTHSEQVAHSLATRIIQL